MILGERFVWSHLGRTGGDTILGWFLSAFPHLVTRHDPAGSPAKHTCLKDRPDWNGGRIHAINIRRLPAWHIGYQVHAIVSEKPIGKRGGWSAADEAEARRRVIALSDYPDKILGNYTAETPVNVWLRQESLAADFLAFARMVGGDVGTAPPQLNQRIKAPLPYNHAVSHWLGAGRIAELYRLNPVWAGVEARAYV